MAGFPGACLWDMHTALTGLWAAACRYILLLLWRKHSHDPVGPGLRVGEGGERANRLPTPALVFPQPFQSSCKPCTWGWVTLDRSRTF